MNLWLERCYNGWKVLSSREQWFLLVTVILLVLLGAYAGVIRPLQQQSREAETRLNAETNLLAWVKNQADTIVRHRQVSDNSNSDLPLNQVITSSINQFGIRLIRMQPKSEGIQVWVEPVPFNQFTDWLLFLQRDYGIRVVLMDISRGSQGGMVEIKRLELVRG
jgi:general secretion pathway protein M